MANLTFPYPVQGTVKRPPGQGCSSCEHRTYCPAMYWMTRFGWSIDVVKPDNYAGIQCASWSNNPADRFSPINPPDLEENEYMYNQGIMSEANRNGITAPTTGTNRRP